MDKTSSTVSLRINTDLSNLLKEESLSKGISFNAEATNRLEISFRNNERIKEMFDLVDMGTKYFRIKSSSTYYDKEKILNFFNNIDIDKIVLAARKDDLNGAILVMIIHTNFATFLLDGSSINMARKPRIYEVNEILQSIIHSGLLDITMYCKNYVNDTRDLTVEKAISHLMNSNPFPLNDINEYTSMLKI